MFYFSIKIRFFVHRVRVFRFPYCRKLHRNTKYLLESKCVIFFLAFLFYLFLSVFCYGHNIVCLAEHVVYTDYAQCTRRKVVYNNKNVLRIIFVKRFILKLISFASIFDIILLLFFFFTVYSCA